MKEHPTLILLLGVPEVAAPSGYDRNEWVRRHVPTWAPPCYVAAYDPEVGLPSLRCTTDPGRALVLDSRSAFDLWLSSPANDPVRHDGQPNRPLRAFTVEFVHHDPYLN